MGTVVVPFSTISANKTATVLNCNGCIDADNNGYITAGDTFQYEISVTNIGHTDIGEGFMSVSDTLDPNVAYVPGSTVYIDEDGNEYPISDDSNPAFPLHEDNGGAETKAMLHADPKIAHKIRFLVTIDAASTAAMIYNQGYATSGREKSPFDNWIRMTGTGRNTDLTDVGRPTEPPTPSPTNPTSAPTEDPDDEECPEEL